MNPKPADRREANLDPNDEQALRRLLGTTPQLPQARLRRVREAVFERLTQQPALPPWLRWRFALPAALSLMLLGGALGWSATQFVYGATQDEQGLDLIASALAPDAGGL